ncbi:hypothetical protein AMK01_PB00134 (plasmid) [Rhizobium sp. N6212]|jgi:hypothetical protein|uniref:Insertion sequence transposase protein n=3 Tax=Rhizobium TaxID=379 RepID=A0A7W7EHJ6_RHIET|nr:hypothetical conserved protein [Rhizobium etli CIAT 652]ANK94153.1 hypothetical protein AMK01_PB00134 [Rhizobium sp. N6212]ANL00203.1 hypothetical protein AMK00_PB00133 [Rhizobium sp. N621]ANL06328.1 hypothetical protein AMJ99_PB00129 [Rhizobium esperanzae]ANL12496.1 hypothetical protein AMJ98_PC00132 [Rhizobium sp. N1341]ANL24457.1 hypothetical protein AMJ96_PB00140 [Rhizobium sp. N113]ANL87995.1 hypothetical protein AMC81_PD00138 [Rhizobium phaseoli]ANM37170.1 hypothetical protein AMK04
MSDSGSIICLTTICAIRSLTAGSRSCRDFSQGLCQTSPGSHRPPGCTTVGFDRFVSFVHLPLLNPKRLVCRTYRSHPVSSCSKQYDHLIRSLCSGPITGPSTLIRIGPPQSPASVLSPYGFSAWASPLASGAWFLQFRVKACVQLTPPLRRSPPAQSSGTRRTCPRMTKQSWFRRRLYS